MRSLCMSLLLGSSEKLFKTRLAMHYWLEKQVYWIVKFYQQYVPADQFPGLMHHAGMIIALLWSTYLCEQLFTEVIFVNNKTHSKFTDAYLEGTLRRIELKIKFQKPRNPFILKDCLKKLLPVGGGPTSTHFASPHFAPHPASRPSPVL